MLLTDARWDRVEGGAPPLAEVRGAMGSARSQSEAPPAFLRINASDLADWIAPLDRRRGTSGSSEVDSGMDRYLVAQEGKKPPPDVTVSRSDRQKDCR